MHRVAYSVKKKKKKKKKIFNYIKRKKKKKNKKKKIIIIIIIINSIINKINKSRKFLLIYFLLKNFADLFLKICTELYFLKNLRRFYWIFSFSFWRQGRRSAQN